MIVRTHHTLLAVSMLLTACATTRPAPPAQPAPAGPSVPALAPINRDLDSLQTVWHLRSGLNVAALSCTAHVGPGIVEDYNRLLKGQRPLLSRAYDSVLDRYRQDHGGAGQRALDSHMTRLYNHFAWPPAQPAFCAASSSVLKEALALPPDGFEPYARMALLRLDQPIVAPAPRIAAAAPAAPAPAARTALASAPISAATPWRIQLGAFSGQPAAEAAWDRIRARAPDLGSYPPRYERVPGNRGLVRLQLAAGLDRSDALKLCALASASGFDCLPLAS